MLQTVLCLLELLPQKWRPELPFWSGGPELLSRLESDRRGP